MCLTCKILEAFAWVGEVDVVHIADVIQITVRHSYPTGIDIATAVKEFMEADKDPAFVPITIKVFATSVAPGYGYKPERQAVSESHRIQKSRAHLGVEG